MAVILFATLCIVLAIPVIIILLRQREGRKRTLPPLKSGWIPWIGVAFDFGKQPLFYVNAARKELGDVFTIKAAGKWITFLCDHDDYQLFFHSQHASFEAAVQPFTEAVANVSKSSFFDHHSILRDTVKDRLTPSHLSGLCQNLSRAFHSNILDSVDRFGETKIDLMQFVRSCMFPPVVEELFGKDNLLLTKDEMLKAQNTFSKYDENFEYGVQLPAIFLREWKDCKDWLLNLFSGVVDRVENRKSPPQSLVEHLVPAIDRPNAPGNLLLLLWASQANAIPVSFWTLAYILSNPNILAKIKQELEDWTLDSTGEVQESSLKSIPTIKRAILEAMRLHAPGMITRKVTEPITVKGYTIPAGHLLMLSPYWSHRNSHYFPDAESFKPDRWTSCDIDKGQFLPGFVAFGKGRYQCPGRWFALMEMHLYIAMVLKILDITLLDPVPEPSPLHLVGSQQPIKPCHIKIKKQKYN